MQTRRSDQWAGKLALLAMLSVPMLGAGTTFYWQAGDNSFWNDCDNWAYVGSPPSSCYPTTTGQNATVPVRIPDPDDEGFAITLVNDEIGDFLIQEDARFSSGSCNLLVTLYVERLEIQGGTAGASLSVQCSTAIRSAP